MQTQALPWMGTGISVLTRCSGGPYALPSLRTDLGNRQLTSYAFLLYSSSCYNLLW